MVYLYIFREFREIDINYMFYMVLLLPKSVKKDREQLGKLGSKFNAIRGVKSGENRAKKTVFGRFWPYLPKKSREFPNFFDHLGSWKPAPAVALRAISLNSLSFSAGIHTQKHFHRKNHP
jgi:hypothetical protein